MCHYGDRGCCCIHSHDPFYDFLLNVINLYGQGFKIIFITSFLLPMWSDFKNVTCLCCPLEEN